MNKEQVISKISEIGVLPVVRAADADEARSVVAALVAGGITTIEVTMTVPRAVELIAALDAEYGSDILLGAGTVLEPETAKECIDAGAKFIISPGTNFDTIVYCNDREIAVMPGALTPTEVLNAWDAGADVVKIFPASAMGGASYLKALKAPLPDIKLIPTGGVSLSTAADFINAGAEAVGVGGELVDLAAVRAGTPEKITQAARQYLEIVAAARA